MSTIDFLPSGRIPLNDTPLGNMPSIHDDTTASGNGMGHEKALNRFVYLPGLVAKKIKNISLKKCLKTTLFNKMIIVKTFSRKPYFRQIFKRCRLMLCLFCLNKKFDIFLEFS